MKLWYRQPADGWMESLPVGNGRLGVMVFGGVDRERIALNESTLWSGKRSDQHENPEALKRLPDIRRALFDGRYAEADRLSKKFLLGRQDNFGTNLPLGDLSLQFSYADGKVESYRRELDLEQGIAGVTYRVGDTQYKREILSSNVDDVLAMRLTCDTPGQLSFEASVTAGDKPWEVHTEGNDTLVIAGHAYESRHSNGKCGVGFRGHLSIRIDGGRIVPADRSIVVQNADAATVLVSINTDYAGRDPLSLCRTQVEAAAGKTYAQIREAHVADHQRLFQRVELDLGTTDAARLPTDKRLELLQRGGDDPQLIATFFQYGRYLLIAASRENSPLPMNLQGIWNDNLACQMGWTCDYHMDINTQQNYWSAEVGNLSECHEPLFRLIESLCEPGRRTARKTYGCEGWVCHIFTNAWGFTSQGRDLGWGAFVTGGIWLASH
ncbi:MAG: glycoside hydrolase family 95 protein, partial [Lentisphaerae bacterium]|nr:glycoside hydrolase family 95 protein [Lentisphaerota bacterium]